MLNSRYSKILLLISAILIVSLTLVYSTSLPFYKAKKAEDPQDLQTASIWAQKRIFIRHIVWISLGLIAFFFVSRFNYLKYWNSSIVFYAASILLLIMVLIFGRIILGAQRWLEFAGLNFQPSELTKIAVILLLARYFSQKSVYQLKTSIKSLGVIRAFILPFLLVMVPMGLVMHQPDLGTALILFGIFLGIIFVAEVRLKYIVGFIISGLISTPVLWHFLKDYQKERLAVFVNPNVDPLGAGYTVIQSKIAIGSGRLLGKGWMAGTQNQLNFLPERHTDFIFSVMAEEWGFLGAVILLILYYLLIRECIRIIGSTKDPFARLISTGVTTMLCLQIIINIAMTLGLSPVVGLPLPFLSYGGSSLIMMFMAIGILINIARTRIVF